MGRICAKWEGQLCGGESLSGVSRPGWPSSLGPGARQPLRERPCPPPGECARPRLRVCACARARETWSRAVLRPGGGALHRCGAFPSCSARLRHI